MLLTWPEIQEKNPIILNIGGGNNGHPMRYRQNYIAVDVEPYDTSVWCVKHDLTQPIPLPDASVDQIHCEDFLEHILPEQYVPLLNECYRLLKPGAHMRIGVPDYNNPKDKFCLKLGYDPRNDLHITLTTYDLMREEIARSQFVNAVFYHYWENGKFMHNDIDYSLGWIKRTPDNDPRCRRRGLHALLGKVRDQQFKKTQGADVTEEDLLSQPGHRLHVTSLVVDLIK